MDTLTQSHAYLSELASNPIQFGSNPMGSVSDSTDFGVALREFELVRIVSRSWAIVSDRPRTSPEESINGGEQRFFEFDPSWIEFDPKHSISIQAAAMSIETCRRSIPDFREFFPCGDRYDDLNGSITALQA